MMLQKFYTGDRFGLLIDLHSMADQTMHGSSTWLVNTTDDVQLEIKRKTTARMR